MKPRVLILHNRYTFTGGEERIVEPHVDQLRSNGHPVELYMEDSATFSSRPMGEKLKISAQLPFSMHHYRRVREKIRSFHPSVVHAHNTFPLLTPSVYAAAAAERIPVVQSVHNYRFLCSNGLFLQPNGSVCERCLGGAHWNAVRFRCYGGSRLRSGGMALSLSIHRLLRTFHRTISAFISPSQFLKEKLVKGGLPEKKIFHIPPTILEMGERQHEPEEQMLLYVGRLSREKGLMTLLKAAGDVPDWPVQIVGSGPLEPEMKSFVSARRLANVKFFGHLPAADVASLLQKAAFLVCPSECYENLPTVVLEAWSYGLPVIASRIGGLAEIITEGQNGFLFEPGQAIPLAGLLRSLSLEKSRDLRSSIRGHFERTYSPEVHYANLMALYARVERQFLT